MPFWATEAEIAGIVFTGCRADILDGNEFSSPFRGSLDWANNGRADSQIVNVGVRGNLFGVQILSNEVLKVKDALAAINTAIAAQNTFPVKLTDEMYSINHLCDVDWNQKWFVHGKAREGWIENVTFRFVSKEAV